MRKITHEDWGFEIEFNEVFIHNVVIENKKYFRKILDELIAQFEGIDGGFILSKSSKILTVHKNMYLIGDLLSLNSDSKKINTKILEKIACTVNEEIEIYMEIKSYLEQFYNTVLDKCVFDVTKDTDIKLIDILKLGNFRLDLECEDIIERIIVKIRAIREFLDIDIVVMRNLSQFMDNEEMDLLFNTIASEGIYLLNFESKDPRYVFNTEHRKYIIDEDLCEINSLKI